MKRNVGLVVVSLSVLAGCSIQSKTPDAFHLAQEACNNHGQAAVSYAQQAANLDPTHFGQLASDEAALANNVTAQTTGDGITGLAGQDGTGPGSSYQVLLDCKKIELQLLPGQS